ncbi:MAG: YaaR family protein [Halanaerobiales bacterium]
MRIENKNATSKTGKTRSKPAPTEASKKSAESFHSKLKQIQKKDVKKRLDKLLKLVDREGERLKETLDRKDLLSYKRRVQDFLRILQKEFVNAKQSYSWDESGNVKTHTIIDKVDKNLDVLQNLFLQEQSDVLEIVSKIDEIRGLLMDLYI